MKYDIGDVVYGYAHYHKLWDYCKVESIYEEQGKLFGSSLDKQQYYRFDFESITPAYVVDSPLYQALK